MHSWPGARARILIAGRRRKLVAVMKIARRKAERSALAPIKLFIDSSFVPLGVVVAKLIDRLMRELHNDGT
jgi:hypothetical protein